MQETQSRVFSTTEVGGKVQSLKNEEGESLGLQERKRPTAFRPSTLGIQVYRDWMSIVKMRCWGPGNWKSWRRGRVMIKGAIGGGVREVVPGLGDVKVSAPYHYRTSLICWFDGHILSAVEPPMKCCCLMPVRIYMVWFLLLL
eukprot:g35845.t1